MVKGSFPGPPAPDLGPDSLLLLLAMARDLQAVSATDFPFSGSSYHSCYHSGSSRHQFQTSLLLRLHQSIPPL